MNTIQNYIESLFVGIPDSEKKMQIQNDLLANMEDRYNELIQEGKGEHEAIGITITEFGSIDELLDELGVSNENEAKESAETENMADDAINAEEAEEFLKNYRKSAKGIAMGTLLCILSISGMFFASGTIDDATGMFVMFVFIAVAVGCFIISGMSLSNSGKKLHDRPILKETAHFVSQMKEDFQRSYVVCIVTGVALCILSVAMMFLGGLFNEQIGLSMMMLMIGFGTFLFIYGGMIHSSHEKFLRSRFFIDEDGHHRA